ncbi:sensor domain-containing diguanylate cyclase [Caldimonas tepidiphila]|uniref:GGDEF domain-containing protein n=1 Tax=Caldimonas tepidiphila TaxID=2315841 RepID=UPI000E5AF43D|nr:diguanylate cyclase [Caldimonas tepidiphila]
MPKQMNLAATRRHLSALFSPGGNSLYLLIALAALVGVTVMTVYRSGTTISLIERQNEINRVLPRLQELRIDLLEAETGQRGFLLTGRPSYLKPYHEALEDHRPKLAALQSLLRHDPAEQERLAWIERLVRLKLEELEKTVSLFEQGNREAALALVLSDEGLSYMDDLRTLLGDLSAGLARERDAISYRLAQDARNTRELMIVGALLLLLFASMALSQLAGSLRANMDLVSRLAAEATHCPLTSLYNRRHFDVQLNHEFAIAARNGHPLALLFLDLDGFKKVNDEHGHEAGDRLLQAVAAELRKTVRESDVLARLGGDEFAVLVVDGADDEHRLAGLAQRLIESLHKLRATPAWRSIGVSVGIAMYPKDGESATALLGAADRAMYTAKREGKGRVAFAGGLPGAR